MTLGERIALARKQAGLSQEQLGEKLGVSRQAISKWESSQANPDMAYVAEMCRLFGISSDWLLLGKEDSRQAAPARCPECRAIVTGLDKYCPNCGHPLFCSKTGGETYSLVLTSTSISYSSGALKQLARLPWCKSEFPIYHKTEQELDALIQTAPVTLMWGLTKQQALEALDAFYEQDTVATYRDSDGLLINTLEPAPAVVPQVSLVEKQPMSFGATVCAVILGILIAMLILSFL